MDGVLVIGGCDKNMPGGMMGEDLSIVSAFEAVGAYMAGSMSQEDFEGIERNACPTTGSCGGMYTANTMSSSFEALGMSLLRSSTMANPDPAKRERLGNPAAS